MSGDGHLSLCPSCDNFDLQLARTGRRTYCVGQLRHRTATCAFCAQLSSLIDPTVSDESLAFVRIFNSRQPGTLVDPEAGPLNVDRLQLCVAKVGWFDYNVARSIAEAPDGTMLHLVADEESFAAVSGDVVGRYHGSPIAEENPAIEEWLKGCLSHDACCQSSSGALRLHPLSAQLPTRCINVGYDAGEVVVLEETSMSNGTYITLTHRWHHLTAGSKTTSSNYGARKRQLSVEGLPRVFQDAIKVTRRLKIKYLWIDCICIIQEAQDWKIEALKMAQYYQGAILNLMATRSDQLLPEQFDFKRRLVRLPYRDRSGTRKGWFYTFPYKPLDQSYMSEIRASEIFERAWIYQEWLLSRRIVFFTSESVILECQSALPRNELNEMIRETSHGEIMLKSRSDMRTANHDTLFWYKLVATYSALGLTKPEEDRLVALNGASREAMNVIHPSNIPFDNPQTQSAQPTDYVAGLWTRDLHFGLLWEQLNGGHHERLHKFPTWSWSSIQTPVIWAIPLVHKPIKPALKLLRVENLDDQNNPSILHIEARVLRVRLDRFLAQTEIDKLILYPYRPRALDDTFRAVRSPATPHRLCGWASLENSDFCRLELPQSNQDGVDSGRPLGPEAVTNDNRSEDLSRERATAQSNGTVELGSLPENYGLASHVEAQQPTSTQILAVHVSTLRNIRGGADLGHILPHHDAFAVLFVRRNARDNHFHRIGVGVLFGRDVVGSFPRSPYEKMSLV